MDTMSAGLFLALPIDAQHIRADLFGGVEAGLCAGPQAKNERPIAHGMRAERRCGHAVPIAEVVDLLEKSVALGHGASIVGSTKNVNVGNYRLDA